MKQKIKSQVIKWTGKNNIKIDDIKLRFFSNRNIFQDELMMVAKQLLQKETISEDVAYIISAMIGELGNNSFDHNMGNWPNERGIVFGYNFDKENMQIVIADNGQGILKTLKGVRPNLKNDKQALKVAFTEIVSGRAPEARGNGLKFVRQNIADCKMQLLFISGKAKVILNGEMQINDGDGEYEGCLAILNFNK